MNEHSSLPHPDCDRSLQEAYHGLKECLRPSGPDGEIDEWSIYDESLRRLVRWAESSGQFLENLQPVKEGGREHYLTFVEDGGYWLKFTKPAKAGYIVSFDSGMPGLIPALPIDYIQRLLLQNELFADVVTYAGVGGTRQEPRIITRQPHVPGEAASRESIHSLMVDQLCFQPLPHKYSVGYVDSLAFVRDDVAVFDLRPANVVCTDEGLIVPIDAIPTYLNPEWQKTLQEAAISA